MLGRFDIFRANLKSAIQDYIMPRNQIWPAKIKDRI